MLMDAGKPAPYLVGGSRPYQPNIDWAWQKLAKELGFVWHSAQLKANGEEGEFTAEVL